MWVVAKRSRRNTYEVKSETVRPSRVKPFFTQAGLDGARRLVVRVVVMVRLRMVRLRMVRLRMVPDRGVPVVAVHIGERHCRGSERGCDEESKSLLENEFHLNPGGS
jgi:hypothetical protein